MARNKTRLAKIVDGLSNSTAGVLADLLGALIEKQAGDDLSDLDAGTTSAARRKAKKQKAEKAGKVKKSKRSKKSSDDEDDEPKGKKSKKSKKEKLEAFDGAPTIDDCIDFQENYEGEPAAGGIRELNAKVKAYGGDPEGIITEAELEDAKRSEKAEALGMFVAANDLLAKKLALSDDDDLAELAEELGVEVGKNKKKTIAALIAALNSPDEDEEDGDDDEDGDEDEDEDGDDEDGDDDEDEEDADEDEDGDEDEDEEDDEDEDDEPKKKKGKKSKDKKSAKGKKKSDDDDDDDDDSDLEDIEDIDDED